ncbi:MAG: hypothetical protein C0434_16085 [Xanthomonadaceae bacterium]|nr:hypothetical protein [Xanthomonadaceae bacterium]
MNITLDIERSLLLPVDHARALSLLDDLEATIGRFPNLKALTPLGPNQYRWDMRTMGVRIARIAHDLSYAAQYEIDRKAAAIRWQPLRGHGNALIAGEIRLSRNGGQTEMRFRVDGVMHEVPVPLLYRPLAGPFIVNKMTTLIERYLAATAAALATPAP